MPPSAFSCFSPAYMISTGTAVLQLCYYLHNKTIQSLARIFIIPLIDGAVGCGTTAPSYFTAFPIPDGTYARRKIVLYDRELV
jgi:hypothetical protein